MVRETPICVTAELDGTHMHISLVDYLATLHPQTVSSGRLPFPQNMENCKDTIRQTENGLGGCQVLQAYLPRSSVLMPGNLH
jgi:hypothetical protein